MKTFKAYIAEDYIPEFGAAKGMSLGMPMAPGGGGRGGYGFSRSKGDYRDGSAKTKTDLYFGKVMKAKILMVLGVVDPEDYPAKLQSSSLTSYWNPKDLEKYASGKRTRPELANTFSRAEITRMKKLASDYAKDDSMQKYRPNQLDPEKSLSDIFSAYIKYVVPLTKKKTNEDVDEALSMAQRRAKGRVMKRIKAKLALGRKKQAKKPADAGRLKKRADKQARSQLFTKFAAGKSKDDLPVARKAEIEKRLDKAKPRIQKMARKLLPKLRKLDKERRSSGGK